MERNYTFTGDFSPEAVAGVLSIEMILALIANGVVLVITIYQRKSWKQSSTIFFTSLILAHLVLTLYLPFSIATLAAGEWIIGSTDEEKKGTCNFNGFIVLFSAYVMFMTLSLISIDRFLFIVKPHLHKRFMSPRVALVLVIIVWIVNAVFFSSGFINGSGMVYQYIDSQGLCFANTTSPIMAATRFSMAMILLCIIVVTSVCTFCFTRKFINNQSMIVGESVYASKKKRLFGIFGSMLLIYGICFAPGTFLSSFLAIIDPPNQLIISAVILFFLAIILSPVVQSYFRPEINSVIVNIICHKIMDKPDHNLTVKHDSSCTNTVSFDS
ncbi:PREDICTED: G-protein coupled receptor 87-like [Amphimedon queenslandica]|uniref:G-protein coupled receptors family 1 profile domain-containing protein n=1 Tax=Amphimedon queenslandica TaxID=400682 RepID=A0A1X7UID6_AMPQE|nr:PREDICTED: G-protein coupled receptor 87-like [Amphimedon queenslandica]|eukprot:XP_011404958.1 PREDICTED: G-protein coupled receptor 87-like [Amphimedon queenslandica]